MVRAAGLLGVTMLVSACVGAPVALVAASYGLDGISLLGTGKTFTDQVISVVVQQDCALVRIVLADKVCKSFEDEGFQLVTGVDSVGSDSSDGWQIGCVAQRADGRLRCFAGTLGTSVADQAVRVPFQIEFEQGEFGILEGPNVAIGDDPLPPDIPVVQVDRHKPVDNTRSATLIDQLLQGRMAFATLPDRAGGMLEVAVRLDGVDKAYDILLDKVAEVERR